MKISSLILFNSLIFSSFPLSAAPRSERSVIEFTSPAEDPLTVGRKVAQRFIDVPHPNFDGNPAPTREITYPETITWLGAIRFASLTGDSVMMTALEDRFLPILGAERKLQPMPDHVDHTVFGTVPLGLYMATGNKAYGHLGRWYADTQWQRAGEMSGRDAEMAANGLSWQTRFWIDDMYMISAIQGHAFRAFGDSKYLDRAAHEMTVYLDSIQCDNGLFYHAPDAPYHWCRGNGWMAAGMAELLSLMPESHPERPRIMKSYVRMMDTLLSMQRADGLWGQLLDAKEAWSETSGSAMFVYAMITGVRKGWLDAARFAPAVRRGWSALVSHINEDGDIDGVCEGTNRSTDREFYLHRRTLLGNMHGQAPILWCASALISE